MTKNTISDVEMPIDDYFFLGNNDKASKRRFTRMLRKQYDARLAQLREQPLVDWQIIPSGDEVARTFAWVCLCKHRDLRLQVRR